MAFNGKTRMYTHQAKRTKLDAIDILIIGVIVAGSILLWFALANLI